MSEPELPPAEENHLIRQAEVPPLDVDGVQAATIGSALFAIATVIMAIGGLMALFSSARVGQTVEAGRELQAEPVR